MRNSHARRLSLKRPGNAELEAIEREIFDLEETMEPLRGGAATAHRRCARISSSCSASGSGCPSSIPIDIRFRDFQPQPEPNTKAVMFCLMDVSGSMGEREKDLAKRFFVLLHLFLKRRYDRIDVVFIRHTHEAQEVDEETFFYSRETGGTVVSSALDEMLKIVQDRYPADQWNIYAAQASDGDNYPGDGACCVSLLSEALMPLCQYYAYVEILDEREIDVFRNADERRRALERLSRGQGSVEEFRDEADRPARATSIPCSANCSPRHQPEESASDGARYAAGQKSRDRIDKPKPLFEGSDWNFETMRASMTRSRRSRVGELGLDVYPNQVEIISSEQMLDAYSSVGMPLMYQHWSFGKQFVRAGEALPQGPYGPRLRDGDQLQSLHHLQHGREHHADADPRHGACRLRPQPFLQEQLSVPAMDRCRRHPAIPGIRSRTTSPTARSGTGSTPSRRMLDAAHALMDQGVFRYRRPPELTEKLRTTRARERQEYEEQTFNDLWRTVPQGSKADRADRVRSASSPDRTAHAQAAGGKPALFPREEQPDPGALAARAAARSSATSRSISIRRSRPR